MKNFLTEEEVNELKSQHRTEKNRKIGDRIKAVLASNDGWSYPVESGDCVHPTMVTKVTYGWIRVVAIVNLCPLLHLEHE